ncbi:DUF4037 domain-containing protein [Gorillibacterium timonense]|uniref:DUF4037 domain-containing protein n=1 Tax=Gorillibacterium timonense TaxID=1689269 RepID=UPI00071DBE4D|nr:DUF4037 domain-containing protein [Gorillibacterium timonense]
MKGLDLSEQFYWEMVRPILERRFPTLLERHAAGLIGYGSDVLGHDDALSRDHEWGARCHLWLLESDYDEVAALLNEALHEELPFTYKGFPVRFSLDDCNEVLIPYNGSTNLHHVAITTVQRHRRIQLGLQSSRPSMLDWLVIPEQKLLEWTRGRIFTDPVGDISQMRETLSYLPDEVWRFKLKNAWSSFSLLRVARLTDRRGESLSARLVINRMVEKAVQLIFLYHKKYRPGTYKWISRELSQISPLADQMGKQLEGALMEISIPRAVEQIEMVLDQLFVQHNELKLTEPLTLQPPPPYARGMQTYSYKSIEEALFASLPEELKQMELSGAVDQFVTNEDILIWADHYTKFKPLFMMKSDIERTGIGDMIV